MKCNGRVLAVSVQIEWLQRFPFGGKRLGWAAKSGIQTILGYMRVKLGETKFAATFLSKRIQLATKGCLSSEKFFVERNRCGWKLVQWYSDFKYLGRSHFTSISDLIDGVDNAAGRRTGRDRRETSILSLGIAHLLSKLLFTAPRKKFCPTGNFLGCRILVSFTFSP